MKMNELPFERDLADIQELVAHIRESYSAIENEKGAYIAEAQKIQKFQTQIFKKFEALNAEISSADANRKEAVIVISNTLKEVAEVVSELQSIQKEIPRELKNAIDTLKSETNRVLDRIFEKLPQISEKLDSQIATFERVVERMTEKIQNDRKISEFLIVGIVSALIGASLVGIFNFFSENRTIKALNQKIEAFERVEDAIRANYESQKKMGDEARNLMTSYANRIDDLENYKRNLAVKYSDYEFWEKIKRSPYIKILRKGNREYIVFSNETPKAYEIGSVNYPYAIELK